MIWQNPWAWLGLATLALPVLIHLLGRGRAPLLRFPSLRFVDATRPTPLSRTRIHDPLLLVLRLTILGVGVLALAEPLVQTRARRRASSAIEARAVILDTSESVRRSMLGGLDSARAVAQRAKADARASVLVRTSNARQVLDGAIQWLARQPGKRTLVVVSDFQIGTVDSATIAQVPRDIGIELVRLGSVRRDSVVALRGSSTTGAVDVRAVVGNSATDVDWRHTNVASPEPLQIEMLAGPTEAAAIAALRRAALETPIAAPADSMRRITIVFPFYERRGALTHAGEPLSDWMMDVVLRLAGDSTLAVAAANDSAIGSVPAGVVVARDARDEPSVVAVRDGERLVLFENANAASVTSAALIAGVTRSRSSAMRTGELEPETIPDETLAAWRRPASPAPHDRAASSQDDSDGRWLWMIVLFLLAVETWMRRERMMARSSEESRELAA